ncbi:hypothetical protein SK37_04792 [Citrobacter sp. MGH109]|uniref:Uncharacterized protein n=2 Tax=Klebsiella/Raoultella group TaxID=2890311 RepID=A0A564MZK0_9ENTR|nr:hypothetical protein SK37_04792 [Citrobacter sp. MGH109]WOL82913.1 hypothetical protein CKCNOHLF_00023 [Enterobacter hormaechei subsp. hoffmannii]CAE6280420.1 hypothetical protein AI2642V1_4478 [Citrobacter freundii]SAI34561.1 Uncharacterised protein [Enterobacter hormaechei]VDR28251.1 Uncharacterised protein [Raoultella terrigena]VUS99064.1 hypothetical protein SB6422_03343 [Klebsiella huaxiensis]BBV47857.1 hypothetical protein STW0522CIT27_42970 [Citrobacter portucalensis]
MMSPGSSRDKQFVSHRPFLTQQYHCVPVALLSDRNSIKTDKSTSKPVSGQVIKQSGKGLPAGISESLSFSRYSFVQALHSLNKFMIH